MLRIIISQSSIILTQPSGRFIILYVDLNLTILSTLAGIYTLVRFKALFRHAAAGFRISHESN